MKGAFLYVDAGKGHYIPAVALADSFKEMGGEADVEDLFKVFKSWLIRKACKEEWRFLLHHPTLENKVHSGMDGSKYSHRMLQRLTKVGYPQKKFKEWFERTKPDFIVSTNFLGAVILPSLMRELGIHCPIYDYEADLFDQVKCAIDPFVTCVYVPTQLGVDNTINMGQRKESVKLTPFPLSLKIQKAKIISKKEAREKLSLPDKFTVLINLGGEGIGNIDVLYYLAQDGANISVVAVGGKSKTTQKEIKKFKAKYPTFSFVFRGFVDNIQDYIMASDMQMGKAGANSLMESLYLKRPFLISELLYAARSTPEFFEEHYVGWCENDSIKQAEIIERLFTEQDEKRKIEEGFNNLGIDFGADKLMSVILNDTLEYQEKVKNGLPVRP